MIGRHPNAPAVGTRLVSDPSEPERLTAVRETDARTALTRGLAEYVSQLGVDCPGGRFLAFHRVFDAWSEPETVAVYPSAAVYSTQLGVYEDSRLTPAVSRAPRLLAPDGRWPASSAELRLDVMLDVWTTDPEMRQELVAMLEEALSPLDGRYGLLLELPHYFGQRATYEPVSVGYLDSEDAAQRRVRRAQIVLRARVAVTRLASLPEARPRHATSVVADLGSVVKSGVIRGMP